MFKTLSANTHLRYLLLRLFPRWLYSYSTKVRIPKSVVDFRKMLVAKYILQHGGTAIDVGAHVGYHTRYLAEIIDQRGMLWAFEPNPYIFKLLHKYGANKGGIRVEQKAVSDRSAQFLYFYVTPYSLEQDSTLEPSRQSQAHKMIEVETIALDDLLQQGLSDLKFIKIDVEGHESKVLAGAQKVIKQFRPYIVFEYAPKELEARANPLSLMLACDYLCFDLSSLRFLSSEDMPDLTDVLAFAKEKGEEIAPLCDCLKLF